MIPADIVDGAELAGLTIANVEHERRWLVLTLSAPARDRSFQVAGRGQRLLRGLRRCGYPATWRPMERNPETGAPLVVLRVLPWKVADDKRASEPRSPAGQNMSGSLLLPTGTWS